MNLADVFIYLFSILGFVIVFISYWLMAAALFPQFVERAAERFGSSPVKAVLLGALIGAPVVVIGLTMSGKAPNGALKILGLVAAFIPILFALFGSAGLAMRIGRGMPSSRDETDPWRRTLRGGVVLGLSFVLPFVGQFALMAFAFLGGFGVCLLNLFSRRRLLAPAPLMAPPLPPAFAPSTSAQP